MQNGPISWLLGIMKSSPLRVVGLISKVHITYMCDIQQDVSSSCQLLYVSLAAPFSASFPVYPPFASCCSSSGWRKLAFPVDGEGNELVPPSRLPTSFSLEIEAIIVLGDAGHFQYYYYQTFEKLWFKTSFKLLIKLWKEFKISTW